MNPLLPYSPKTILSTDLVRLASQKRASQDNFLNSKSTTQTVQVVSERVEEHGKVGYPGHDRKGYRIKHSSKTSGMESNYKIKGS